MHSYTNLPKLRHNEDIPGSTKAVNIIRLSFNKNSANGTQNFQTHAAPLQPAEEELIIGKNGMMRKNWLHQRKRANRAVIRR